MTTLQLEPVPLPAALLAHARAWERSIARARAEALEAAGHADADDDGIVQAVADDLAYLTHVAGEALATHITRRGNDVTSARWLATAGTWPAVLELARGEHHRHCLVVAEPSSMQPGEDWPVRIGASDVAAWDVDAVLCAYVPKRTTLEGATNAVPREAWLVGWSWADRVRGMATVTLEPHPGHPFSAEYHELRCDQLEPPSTMVARLFDVA